MPEKGKLPDDIPAYPNGTYKDKGWNGMGDWLGTGTIASYNIQFRTFSVAKKFIHTLKLQNEKQWRDYCKSGNKPDNIPTTPARHYKKDNINSHNMQLVIEADGLAKIDFEKQPPNLDGYIPGAFSADHFRGEHEAFQVGR